MSVEAPTNPKLAGGDQPGDSDFWEHAEGQMESEVHTTDTGPETKTVFVPFDVGRYGMFAGQAAVRGAFAESFSTNRIVPRREIVQQILPQIFLGPDNYIG